MNLQIVAMLLLLSSCSMLETDRSFMREMDDSNEGLFVPKRDFPVVAGDSGQKDRNIKEVEERTPKDEGDEEKYQQRLTLENQLARLVDALPEEEYRHYQNYKDYLPTTSNKIYFLKLQGMRERDEYLVSKGVDIGNTAVKHDERLAITGRDIFVGMSKNAVLQSWGHPYKVDIAGNPIQENERWTFISSGQTRYVFFEAGRVRGWILE